MRLKFNYDIDYNKKWMFIADTVEEREIIELLGKHFGDKGKVIINFGYGTSYENTHFEFIVKKEKKVDKHKNIEIIKYITSVLAKGFSFGKKYGEDLKNAPT